MFLKHLKDFYYKTSCKCLKLDIFTYLVNALYKINSRRYLHEVLYSAFLAILQTCSNADFNIYFKC